MRVTSWQRKLVSAASQAQKATDFIQGKTAAHQEAEAQPEPKSGAHAFRRFRATWLRKQHAPEDLIRFWLGHANKSVTDLYSKLKEDETFRKEVAEQVGIGFELPIEKPAVAPYCTHTELLPHVA